MRIISGKARGTKLFTLDGLNTRPTLDRVKEPLFSIIQEYVLDSDVLDLFAGSGALGLEALSRGAKSAILCDNSKEAVDIIYKNITKTKLNAEVINNDFVKTNYKSEEPMELEQFIEHKQANTAKSETVKEITKPKTTTTKNSKTTYKSKLLKESTTTKRKKGSLF